MTRIDKTRAIRAHVVRHEERRAGRQRLRSGC